MINWFLKKYLPKHKIKVKVIRKSLNNLGELYIMDNNFRPRSFLIYIEKNLNSEEYRLTLFHELWHIRQYVTGELKMRRNKIYHNNIDVTDEPDDETEHEEEAVRMEEILLKQFLHS